jgi:hypothetical protein
MGLSVRANEQTLKDLQMDRNKHEELVRTLDENMKSRSAHQMLDEKGVGDLVATLYKLKHFGKNLQSVRNTVVAANEATYRERPINVNSRRHGRQPAPGHVWSAPAPMQPAAGPRLMHHSRPGPSRATQAQRPGTVISTLRQGVQRLNPFRQGLNASRDSFRIPGQWDSTFSNHYGTR